MGCGRDSGINCYKKKNAEQTAADGAIMGKISAGKWLYKKGLRNKIAKWLQEGNGKKGCGEKGCRICCRKTGATAAEHFEKQNPCPVSPSSNHPSSPHRPIANLGPQDLEEGCPCWKSPWPPRACSANSKRHHRTACAWDCSHVLHTKLGAGLTKTQRRAPCHGCRSSKPKVGAQRPHWTWDCPQSSLSDILEQLLGDQLEVSQPPPFQATWHVPAAWDQHPKHQPNQPGPWKWLHPSFQSVAKLEPKPYRNRFLSLLQPATFPSSNTLPSTVCIKTCRQIQRQHSSSCMPQPAKAAF